MRLLCCEKQSGSITAVNAKHIRRAIMLMA